MSPPGQGLSTLPPPPKRHQVGPPGQPDAVNPAQSRPAEQRTVPPVTTSEPQSYPYYRNMNSSYNSRPYHSASYSTTPSGTSPAAGTNGPNHSTQSPADRSSLNPLGHPGSPHSRPQSSSHSPATSTSIANPPPRVISSSYDTRPPPTTTSSGFASVNAPTNTGFASINPRTTATPPTAHAGPTRPLQDLDHKTPTQPIGSNGIDSTRFHSYTNTPSATPTLAANTASKRTPSTTHPYQMSEAFANRHHHCERVDGLNRGIWTSYGVGGTQENPVGPATEMYLRCNHDGCSRIDWRTVHGLQCHIVKNHEQPKGTIGSLDKALEKYGVPVKEVEDYEREHGRGSAGTVADPKNHKIKVKTKEALTASPHARTAAPGLYGLDPQARPAGYRPSPTPTSNSPTLSDEVKRSPVVGFTNGISKDASKSDNSTRTTPSAPPVKVSSNASSITSAPVPQMQSEYRTDWMGRPLQLQTPSRLDPDQKKLQGDFGASSSSSPAPNNAPILARPAVASGPTQSNQAPQATEPASLTASTGPAVALPPNPSPTEVKPAAPPVSNPSVPATGLPVSDVPNATGEATPVPLKAEQDDSGNAKKDQPQLQGSDPDTHMTGTDQSEAAKQTPSASTGKENGSVEQTSLKQVSQSPDDNSEDQSETIVVDGDTGKAMNDISGARKSNLQSPTITAKTLTSTTPGSARRPSRRLSTARTSADTDGDASYAKENRGVANTNGDADDKDDKDSKDEREKTPQRRFASGRVLRRGRV